MSSNNKYYWNIMCVCKPVGELVSEGDPVSLDEQLEGRRQRIKPQSHAGTVQGTLSVTTSVTMSPLMVL